MLRDTDHLREANSARMLTVREYAEKHGVSYGAVYYWLTAGKLEGAALEGRPALIPENSPRPPTRRPDLIERSRGPYLKPRERARHKETGKVAVVAHKVGPHLYYHFEGEPEFPQLVGGASDFSEKLENL